MRLIHFGWIVVSVPVVLLGLYRLGVWVVDQCEP